MMYYYFALATKEFWYEIEPVEEVLRERTHYYISNKKQIDFWILEDPAFLNACWDELESMSLGKKSSKELAAIVSTDLDFIYWIKLRYQNIICGWYTGPTEEVPEPLAFNSIP
uniref:Ycf54 n=1 Tax=Pseudellipsoidion edaphicum TaxID=1431838 RepID=A0A410D2W0_9STRA|nr:hypothetical protein Ycf54 [Pseudellipsoidion edaphicum]QAA12064.1 hypothetical protein Ycf54 [Pseudellipsoidion edaphicum]